MKFSTPMENTGFKTVAVQFSKPEAALEVPVARSCSPSPQGRPAGRQSFLNRWCNKPGAKSFTGGWRHTLPLAILGLGFSLAAHAQTVTFDFDSGTPAPTPGKTTPFSYDSGGVTAVFSSTTANGFSVQDANSVPGTGTLSLFSGLFLNPNSIERAPLDIKFSQGATSITLVFATAQSTAVEIPNPITLSAYVDSTANPVGSPLTVPGVWRVGSVTEAFPSAALTFTSDAQHPFNLVEIVLASGGAGGVMLDNIGLTTTPGPVLQSSGTTRGPYTDDLTATVDGAQKAITIAMKGTSQFYRLRSTVSTRITQIRTVGSQVVLNYE